MSPSIEILGWRLSSFAHVFSISTDLNDCCIFLLIKNSVTFGKIMLIVTSHHFVDSCFPLSAKMLCDSFVNLHSSKRDVEWAEDDIVVEIVVSTVRPFTELFGKCDETMICTKLFLPGLEDNLSIFILQAKRIQCRNDLAINFLLKYWMKKLN